MTKWRDDVEAALRSIGGQGTLSEIYEAVRSVRQGNLPPSWQAIVRRELEYNSSDSDSHQKRFDLFYSVRGIGSGVWGLRELEARPVIALDAAEPPARIVTTVVRVIRDTQMTGRIKRLRGNKCQICSCVLRLPDGRSYSEAHHIQPLGSPHNGPDIAANILVVCPNHHALLDFGAMRLDPSALIHHDAHRIDPRFITYHNDVVAAEVVSEKTPPAGG